MHVFDDARGDAMSLHFRFALSLAIAAMLSVSACGEETPREATPAPQRSKSNAPHEAKWLDASNPLTPAQWLASRGNAREISVNDPRVTKIDAELKTAHRVYRESERMIANRAAQLSDMLKANGIDEDAGDIVANLAAVPGEVGQTEGFGAIAQMYHTLRTSGASRAEALANLKSRYGARLDRNE